VFRAIVVDDERHTREGIAADVPWRDLGIECVGLGADGMEALALLGTAKPDILLCDVRMPRMDGVELSRRARELDAELQIVFLSGYSDKEYLKTAIEVGAVDYVEKPINTGELVRALEKARDRCAAQRFDTAEEFRAILAGLPAKADSRRPSHAGLGSLKGPMVLAAVALHPETRPGGVAEIFDLVRKRNYEATVFKDAVFILTTAGDSGSALGRAIADLPADVEAELGIRAAVLVSPVVHSVDQISVAARKAESLGVRVFYHGFGRTYWYKRRAYPPTSAGGSWRAELRELLPAGNPADQAVCDRLLRRLRDVTAQLRRTEPADVESIRALFARIAAEIERSWQPPSSGLLDLQLWRAIGGASELAEIENRLSAYVKDTCEGWQAIARLSPPVYRALCYVRERFFEEIPLDHIARAAGVTPNHLSGLFKKKVGCTIGEYVAQSRVTAARRLLRESSETLESIASHVGYRDAAYFCRVFKRFSGCTPTEYRNGFG
jgi:two-component system response regulator YesN